VQALFRLAVQVGEALGKKETAYEEAARFLRSVVGTFDKHRFRKTGPNRFHLLLDLGADLAFDPLLNNEAIQFLKPGSMNGWRKRQDHAEFEKSA